MNGQQHQLQITALPQVPVVMGQAAGDMSKRYSAWTWYGAEAVIDGRPMADVTIKTLNANVMPEVRPGWAGVVEEDEHGGKVSYKIRSQNRQNAPQNVPPPQQGYQQAPPPHAPPVANYGPPAPPPQALPPELPQPYSPPPITSYTLTELEALMDHAFSVASQIVGTDDKRATCAYASTFIIACQREHLKAPDAIPMAPRPQAGNMPADLPNTLMWNVIRQQPGAAERVQAAQVPDAELQQWWAEAGGSGALFTTRFLGELQRRGV